MVLVLGMRQFLYINIQINNMTCLSSWLVFLFSVVVSNVAVECIVFCLSFEYHHSLGVLAV